MRRPDLPLIALVLAVGAVLAVFAEGGDRASSGSEALSGPDRALLRCLSTGVDARDSGRAAPDDPAALVRRVAPQVERLRELRFSEPVDARFLRPAELRSELSSLVAKGLPKREVAGEDQVLELLGAIPPGTDLLALTRRALGSQVAGLYDPRTERLLVRSQGAAGALERITLAHELEHALVDQRLGLREGAESLEAADRDLAYSAVVEGDATLLTQRYSTAYVGLAEQLDPAATSGLRQFDRLPDYVQRGLLFPYLEGLRLVCHRWDAGGWDAVDRLYRRPPAATDEVLFPGRYGDGPPTDPQDPARPPGWRPVFERELGAAELEWLFAAPGGEPEAGMAEPRRLVAGWAGGELRLFGDGEARALGIALAELPRANLLCGALGSWYRAAHPEASVERVERGPNDLVFSDEGQSAALVCRGDEVRMGIAPGPQTAAELAR